ncbi:MAG: transcriptional repressor LexA [Rhodospirillaceae bacterium]|nr:transcriptional repressor LexA [Rhodospirillaceae bacterium]MBT5245440.1 transcriptional repressor LexA [Rhodospirillaceae bacterium]MBT5562596.1 transcriptional repressor LexA [Rhodospirillaceae bacterium]MBT6242546.1 transcriptional repressor LexA [Rhodospirillaceae bacterium]MBT7137195.1 transcriptional repressor LexA [Rhodospirillaceae bacterium]
MLTKKQCELLLFIDQRLKESGVSPSFDEMKDALGLASKSGIHRLITGLEERGFIRRLPHRARALEILRRPENMEPTGNRTENEGFKPNVIQGDFKISGAEPVSSSVDESGTVHIPRYEKIAAGLPIEAVDHPSNSIAIPADMIGKGKHYALEIDGESMIDEGIHDGDTVIIRHADNAENGAIVVAIIDNEEVTLKRLRRKGNSIALEAANKDFETRIFGPDRVKVQGQLVGLLRKY